MDEEKNEAQAEVSPEETNPDAVEAAPAAETPAPPLEEAPAPPAAEAPAAAPAYETSPKKWFILHTYSGFENSGGAARPGQAFGFDDKIGQILIPTEEVVSFAGRKSPVSAWCIPATCC
jgi:transcriptional antiterminator NusG